MSAMFETLIDDGTMEDIARRTEGLADAAISRIKLADYHALACALAEEEATDVPALDHRDRRFPIEDIFAAPADRPVAWGLPSEDVALGMACAFLLADDRDAANQVLTISSIYDELVLDWAPGHDHRTYLALTFRTKGSDRKRTKCVPMVLVPGIRDAIAHRTSLSCELDGNSEIGVEPATTGAGERGLIVSMDDARTDVTDTTTKPRFICLVPYDECDHLVEMLDAGMRHFG